MAFSAVCQGRRIRKRPGPDPSPLTDAARVPLQSGQLGHMSIAALAEEQQAAQQQQLAHVARAQQFLGQRQQGGGGLQVGPWQGFGAELYQRGLVQNMLLFERSISARFNNTNVLSSATRGLQVHIYEADGIR